MADPNISQYKYSAMSNLVLQADRRLYSRNKDENTGDPESLAGRLNIRDMGSRVARDQAPKQKKMAPGLGVERGTIHEGEDVLERERRKRKRGEPAQTRGAGILSAGDALIEGLKYRPRTPATRATYDLLLTVTANALGDVSQEIVRSAADAILEFLKDENMKDLDKKKEVDEIVGTTMTPKEFNELVNLGKKITDYDAQDEDEDMDDGDEAELDDRQGVAVVFDEDDEDEDGIARTYEVRDEDEDSDEEDDIQDQPDDEAATAGGAGAPDVDPDEEDTEMVLDSGIAEASRRKREDSDLVPIHEIDAYWLQRQIGSIYSDAHVQQQKTQDALQILSGKSLEGEEISLRDIENDLMDLFDYEHPEIVGKFVTNRDRIVWATRWRRVAEDTDARNLLEVEMVEAGQRAILDELVGNQDTGAEGPRPSKKMKLDLMDIDVPKAQIESQEEKKDGTLSGGLQPQRLINLENLVFEQGNHLMTNPKVVLPQGSTKRTFKGYEEIHVPAPKARVDPGEKLIPTSDLPDWARQGFGSAKSLNRIQSKCYPSAFGDDGNMLVCAPTGSGKTNVAMLTMLREIGKHRNPEDRKSVV